MRSRPLMTLRLNTAPIQNIGATPHGTRVTFPITGGFFDGERLRGKVLRGGDDWTLKRLDGIIELDLRVTLETDDGALIHMTSRAFVTTKRQPPPTFVRCRASRQPNRSIPS
jgi:hypothetical protein